MRMDCLFCKIIKKEISSEVVYEDDNALAVGDAHPLSMGHTLVLPKIHAENLLDLPEDEIGPVFLAVKKITEKLKRQFNPQGFTIGINHGRISRQAIDHLHIHIIPRYESDGGGSIHSIFK